MPNIFTELANMPRARLSRRIVVWVFMAVLVIEAIILIPSYKNRRRELLTQLKTITTAKAHLLVRTAGENPDTSELMMLFDQNLAGEKILGGGLYSGQGRFLGAFGKNPPAATDLTRPVNKRDSLDKSSYRYDAVVSLETPRGRYTLVVRHDAGTVKGELRAFILRITGLTVIISIFVTVATWLALNPLVVRPILGLRRDLISAGQAVEKDRTPDTFHSAAAKRNDELGDVIGAFQHMFGQIQEAISRRKRAEQSLQASLHQVKAVSEALNRELEKGHQIQRDFLPKKFPELEGWDISAAFFPARQVSGDFYDVFKLPGGYIGLVIGDVSDKGVGAALYMALIRSLIRIFSGHYRPAGPDTSVDGGQTAGLPAQDLMSRSEILKAAELTSNYIIQEHDEEGMFASLFLGVLCPHSGELMYVNCGHEPLFVIGGGGLKPLGPTGPAIGVVPEHVYDTGKINLNLGDTLLGYTDGVTEACSTDKTLFTRQRLKKLILTEPVIDTRKLLARIRTGLLNFVGDAEQSDDIAIFAVQRYGDIS